MLSLIVCRGTGDPDYTIFIRAGSHGISSGQRLRAGSVDTYIMASALLGACVAAEMFVYADKGTVGNGNTSMKTSIYT